MNHNLMKKVTSSILLGTMLLYQAPIFAYSKEETVYSKLNTSGDSYSTLSSCHLINSENDSMLNDISTLFHIKNTNGSEEFSVTEEGSLVWQANGNDIYYQGESNQELPIQCHIKYELDGEEISAEDLAGKSGTVKISIEYVNLDEHTILINGKEETMYTPFVVLCGTIMDHENHKNIQVSSGKVIDDRK